MRISGGLYDVVIVTSFSLFKVIVCLAMWKMVLTLDYICHKYFNLIVKIYRHRHGPVFLLYNDTTYINSVVNYFIYLT